MKSYQGFDYEVNLKRGWEDVPLLTTKEGVVAILSKFEGSGKMAGTIAGAIEDGTVFENPTLTIRRKGGDNKTKKPTKSPARCPQPRPGKGKRGTASPPGGGN